MIRNNLPILRLFAVPILGVHVWENPDLARILIEIFHSITL